MIFSIKCCKINLYQDMRGCVNRISKINPFFYFFAFQKKEKIIVCGRHYKLVIFHRNLITTSQLTVQRTLTNATFYRMVE